MTIGDLKMIYNEDDLSYYPGDRDLRHRMFSPFLANLDGKKVVYHEKFVAVVKLSEVELTTERFSAVATILLHVEQLGRPLFPPKASMEILGTMGTPDAWWPTFPCPLRRMVNLAGTGNRGSRSGTRTQRTFR